MVSQASQNVRKRRFTVQAKNGHCRVLSPGLTYMYMLVIVQGFCYGIIIEH